MCGHWRCILWQSLVPVKTGAMQTGFLKITRGSKKTKWNQFSNEGSFGQLMNPNQWPLFAHSEFSESRELILTLKSSSNACVMLLQTTACVLSDGLFKLMKLLHSSMMDLEIDSPAGQPGLFSVLCLHVLPGSSWVSSRFSSGFLPVFFCPYVCAAVCHCITLWCSGNFFRMLPALR